MKALTDTLRDAFHREETAAYRWTQGVVWALIVLSVLLFGLEISLPGEWWEQPWLHWLDRAVLAFFVVWSPCPPSASATSHRSRAWGGWSAGC